MKNNNTMKLSKANFKHRIITILNVIITGLLTAGILLLLNTFNSVLTIILSAIISSILMKIENKRYNTEIYEIENEVE